MQRSHFLASRLGCKSKERGSSKERVVIGDLYRHHRVMRAGWNIVQVFFKCVLSFGRGRGVTLQTCMQQVLPCGTG